MSEPMTHPHFTCTTCHRDWTMPLAHIVPLMDSTQPIRYCPGCHMGLTEQEAQALA